MLNETLDLAPLFDAFRADVAAGLSAAPKFLPSRWLYDERGSALFEAITQLDDYYPTRVETGILRRCADRIAEFCGEGAVLLEYGAGAGIKTEILLDALASPRLYIPIDIAGEMLDATVGRLRGRFPGLRTQPVRADFTRPFDLPAGLAEGRRVAFFPGSTIGNLDAGQTSDLLRQFRRHVGRFGKAVIGIDLKKDVDLLLRAYDDREGVTAAFNLNLLVRINRELNGDFPVHGFRHEARWNAAESAVEMHLVSRDACNVTVDRRRFAFDAGESIHTESSRKYDRETFAGFAEANGWRVEAIWQDPAGFFAVFGLTANERFY
jgi:dimethylhistidine N-methyltransferase